MLTKLTGITSLYLPEEDVLVGPEDIEKAHIVKALRLSESSALGVF